MEAGKLAQNLNRLKFLFDLNGYIVIRNVLSKQDIADANAAIDKHQFLGRHEKGLRNSKDNTAFSGDMKTPRLDMGGMLGWEDGHNKIFRKFLCHPNLV